MLNPTQHMKDANDSILKVLTNNVMESVEFLEKCLKNFTGEVSMPISDCFKNTSLENGRYEIFWENSISMKLEQIQNYVRLILILKNLRIHLNILFLYLILEKIDTLRSGNVLLSNRKLSKG